MAIIQSCCCWRSLRKGCYAAALYTLVYYTVTIITLGHFIDMEQRYLNGELVDPQSESFLEPEKITHTTVSLNIALLACSVLGVVSCLLLPVGVYKDMKYLLCPWILAMGLETLVEVTNLVYLVYLQTTNFNPITAFLFTLDFFIIALNVYALVCVVSQLQEYLAGRGSAAFSYDDRLAGVQYTATGHQTTTTSSAPSGRRKSAGRPVPSRCEPEEFSEAPTKIISSVLSRSSRSNVKKHVQFPDEQSCIEEGHEPASPPAETGDHKPESRVISSLWMELESEAPAPAPDR